MFDNFVLELNRLHMVREVVKKIAVAYSPRKTILLTRIRENKVFSPASALGLRQMELSLNFLRL